MKSIVCFVLIVVSLVNANVFYDLSKEDYNKVKDSRNFTGKVVLVTGSNSGIGEITVKLFSVLGAQVVVTGRNATTVKSVAAEVQELSPKKLKVRNSYIFVLILNFECLKPLEVVADNTKSADVERLINQTIVTFGRLDVLVNNAGIFPASKILDKNFMQVFDSVFNLNLRSAAELNHLAVPYLMKTNGTIIHISSNLGIAPVITSPT